ncbi:nucleoside triphosphate pyrophosphohydrolase [Chryseomicrobium sp. FSL W7-1435]|uniref:nucleoside triphosphate pyrophosphohydrolase n=1 Tax=Chryseomicrobium sp. FSL W7-1435 TaxID=2921704 RepID=UPI00315A30CC
MTSTYQVLRDRSPERQNSQNTSLEILRGTHLRSALHSQLVAGATRYSQAETDRQAVEELVDLVELVHALLPAHNMTYEELEMVRRRKKNEQGSFTEGHAIVQV